MLNKSNQSVYDVFKACLVSFYNKRIFTASSLSVYGLETGSSSFFTITYGFYDNFIKKPIDDESLFDLASLTKPFVTVLSLLYLFDEQLLRWDDTVGMFLKANTKSSLADLTLESLMKHSSGLPDHYNFSKELEKFSERDQKFSYLLQRLSELSLRKLQVNEPVYSDLGYLILGLVIEAVTGTTLDRFWAEHIARPLGLESCLLYPVRSRLRSDTIVSTRTINDGLVLTGVVHDDNCRALGGVCGHAGLFGTGNGVMRLCKNILHCYQGKDSQLPITQSTLSKALTRQKRGDWMAGFQTPSKKNSSSGSLFTEGSFGHLGYTGTSFWIDPKRELIVVLLTNRAYMGDDKRGIQKMRPEIHDLVGHLRLQSNHVFLK